MSRASYTKSICVLILLCLLAACSQPVAPQATTTKPAPAPQTDLTGIKTYLIEKTTTLGENTAALRQLSDHYYTLAKDANFDYTALWQNKAEDVKATVSEAREVWMKASPLYEQMEGIVAGTPTLADYDVILDAGASGAEDPENAVPFDLTLPDGRVLPKPGNLFGVLESTLWGTFADYTAQGVQADFDNNGTLDFGDVLPEANVFKAAAETLDSYTKELASAADEWQPTTAEAFSALVVMVPTMNEYFGSWRDSRFVAGAASTQRDFVAISRLADIQDILGGLQVVYSEVESLVATVDKPQSEQIATDLQDLKAFVANIYQQENDGKRFSPEEADLLGSEAQNRATAITGQVSQVAAKLNIDVQE